nr:MAG TPA: hypothetical protein [Caudoviricetes sp.]
MIPRAGRARSACEVSYIFKWPAARTRRSELVECH